ncbi:MAG: ATP-binding cassette domain-containing protein [Bacteroidales bacterium]
MIYLQTVNITKNFDKHIALDNVSISIPQAKVFGLLGPNGAGKTTFIRILTGIIQPDTGNILKDTQKFIPQPNKIGYLPEERGLYKKMKVGEQLLYLANLKGLESREAKLRINKWLEILEIPGVYYRKVDTLSKGMQQKIQFIAAVVHNPEFLILDEPFSGFDPVNTQLIKNEIINLKKNGTTIILSTHDMASVEELCDEIALINKSKVVLTGNPFDIRKQQSKEIYEVQFTGYFNKLEATLTPSYSILEHTETGNTTTVKLSLNQEIPVNTLLSHLLKLGNVVSFRHVQPSMNEIFISLVKNSKIENIEKKEN